MSASSASRASLTVGRYHSSAGPFDDQVDLVFAAAGTQVKDAGLGRLGINAHGQRDERFEEGAWSIPSRGIRGPISSPLSSVPVSNAEESCGKGGIREMVLGGSVERAADWVIAAGQLGIAYDRQTANDLVVPSSLSGLRPSIDAMKIDGHYDALADVAWLRFEGYEPARVVAEELVGLRELDPVDGRVVGLEYWRASQILPAELLRMLPAPPLGVAR